MRVTGLASGMNVDDIVKKMMEPRNAALTKLRQKSLLIDYKQEAYRSLSITMIDLRNNKLPDLRMTGAINAKKAEVTGNTSAISATTSSGAAAGIYEVEVKQLGSAASVKVGTGLVNSGSMALKDLGFNGTSINITNELETDPSKKTIEIEYDRDTDTLQSLVDRINNNSKANVTAIYDSSTGDIMFKSKTVGEKQLTIQGFPGAPSVTGAKSEDGIAIVNGVELKATNNQVSINGVTIKLNKETGTEGVSTLTVGTDSKKILDTIKTFISEYNKLLDSVNGKLSEDKFPKYTPLTDDERAELSDKQAELWDQKSRSGLLKYDSILQRTATELRMAIISSFGDDDNFNIQSIGISTGKWQEKGKLVIENEEKLLAAIEADPSRIEALFTARGSSENLPAGQTYVNNRESGIFSRVSDILATSLKLMSSKAGTSQVSTSLNEGFLVDSLMGSEKIDISRKITDLTRKLNMMETRYYKQFTAMETAINKFNSQAGSFSSFL